MAEANYQLDENVETAYREGMDIARHTKSECFDSALLFLGLMKACPEIPRRCGTTYEDISQEVFRFYPDPADIQDSKEPFVTPCLKHILKGADEIRQRERRSHISSDDVVKGILKQRESMAKEAIDNLRIAAPLAAPYL
jgi:ATP-dependent Clp protease ATP-binding subunit ClpA